MKKYLFFLCTLSKIYSTELVNLQDYVQDFVIRTKQIHIPGYPHAFNPSIVKWQGKRLLSFRTHETKKHPQGIGFIWINNNFEPISKPYILQPTTDYIDSQDPRLFVIHNTLYMAYNSLVSVNNRATRRMLFAKIVFKNDKFILQNNLELKGPWDAQCTMPNLQEKIKQRQKNWVPFLWNNKLLFSYILAPHQVVPLQPTGDFCITFSSASLINWPFGELRGGTQALQIGDRYLGFFHSCKIIATKNSDGKKMRYYFMGAYTFKAEPPFNITHISRKPIVGKGFYNGKMDYKTWTDLRVIFPTGLLINKKYIWVTYGRQDFECWVIKMDRKKLLNSLVPCI